MTTHFNRQDSVYLLLLTILMGAATPASADLLITPYLGKTFKGTAGSRTSAEPVELPDKGTYGARVTWMRRGIAGFEGDIGITRNLLQGSDGDPTYDTDADHYVMTLAANFVVGAPIRGTSGGSIRPYGFIGYAVQRSHVQQAATPTTVNDFGLSVGAGIHGFFNDHVGINGDIRFFPVEHDCCGLNVGFSRATVGVSIRLGQ